LYSEKKVLDNLDSYKGRFQTLHEEEIDSASVFTLAEIRSIAIAQRMRFLDCGLYKPGLPSDAKQRVCETETRYRKELRQFMVLACPAAFRDAGDHNVALLFAPTNHNNYYLLHRWGKKPHWSRRLVYWPLRRFETLALAVMLFTLIV